MHHDLCRRRSLCCERRLLGLGLSIVLFGVPDGRPAGSAGGRRPRWPPNRENPGKPGNRENRRIEMTRKTEERAGHFPPANERPSTPSKQRKAMLSKPTDAPKPPPRVTPGTVARFFGALMGKGKANCAPDPARPPPPPFTLMDLPQLHLQPTTVGWLRWGVRGASSPPSRT